MAKKQTKKAKAAKPKDKKKAAPKRTPTARKAAGRRTKPQKAPRKKASPAGKPADRRTPQGSVEGAPNQAARAPRGESPIEMAPEPVLHTQVDREVTPVTDSPAIEREAKTNAVTQPHGTVRT